MQNLIGVERMLLLILVALFIIKIVVLFIIKLVDASVEVELGKYS